MSFIIHNQYIFNLVTKERYVLEDYEPESIAFSLSKVRLKQQKKIKLYLPPSFFVATKVNAETIKNLSQSQLKQALNYQQEELLPGCTGLMSVVASVKESSNIALWIHVEWIDQLQLALNKMGIELDYIALRSLLPAINYKQAILIEDIEKEQSTLIIASDTDIVNCASYFYVDLEEDDIRNEYDSKINEYSKIDQYLRFEKIEDWTKRSTEREVDEVWRFFPSTALQNKVKRRTRRIRLLLMTVVLSALLLLSVPFLKVTYEKYRLKETVENLKTQGQSVIKARSEIAGHTQYWETLDIFPNPRVLSLLYDLDKNIPKHSWLTGFRLREGVIEIEGYSSDPASVLEALSVLSDFEHVAFSQASRQEKAYPDKTFFGIRLQLRQNADEYMERFLSSSRSLQALA